MRIPVLYAMHDVEEATPDFAFFVLLSLMTAVTVTLFFLWHRNKIRVTPALKAVVITVLVLLFICASFAPVAGVFPGLLNEKPQQNNNPGNSINAAWIDDLTAMADNVEYEYDMNGNVTKVLASYYDSDGDIRQVEEFSATGNCVKAIFYDEDNLISGWVVFEYDAGDNLIKYTSYNADGNLMDSATYNADGSLAGY